MRIDYKLTKVQDEQGKTPVFLSHANRDENWRDIAADLRARGVPCKSDRNLNPGDKDFAQEIKKMISDAHVMIVLPYNGKFTPWIAFELGYAEGLGKRIFVYDEHYVKSDNEGYAFKKYGPVYTDAYKLAAEVRSSLFYADVFEYETSDVRKADFKKECLEHIDILKVQLPLPGIRSIPKTVYRFGYILLALGRYEILDGVDRRTDICYTKGTPLTCGCYKDGKGCSLARTQEWETAANVILNKIVYNCSVDRFSGDEQLTVTLPFHRKRGVTFKCFVDLADPDYTEDVVPLLEAAGLTDIGVSYSANGNRIYFMLPPNPRKGVFEVKAPDGPKNNYICKGAIN